jgi:hypothetical protein
VDAFEKRTYTIARNISIPRFNPTKDSAARFHIDNDGLKPNTRRERGKPINKNWIS